MVSIPSGFLFSFDFDGTMVDDDPHPAVHPELNAFLASIDSQGGVWAINTGRTLHQALDGLAQHRIQPLPKFIMAKERELYYPGQFGRWKPLGSWNERCEKEHKRFLKKHRRAFKKVRQHLEKASEAEWVEGLEETPGVIAKSEEEMDRLCEYIDAVAEGDDTLSYQRNSIYLRFAHAAYNKGTVLQESARELGVSREQICSAGDNHNDLAMLCPTVAAYRACPSNAIPEVRTLIEDSEGGQVGSGRASFGLLDAVGQLLGKG